MEDFEVKPLFMLDIGRQARVVALEGGREFRSRLVALGLNVGSDFIFFDDCNSI